MFKYVLVALIAALIGAALAACGRSRPAPPPPAIGQKVIERAIFMAGALDVADAAITVKGNTVSMVVVPKTRLPAADARRLGDNFVRMLGTAAANGMDGLTAPTKETYGSLFDRYTVLISVALDEKTMLAQGAMNKGTQRITW